LQADPVIVQLQVSPPLYVQTHVEPEQAASQSLPALSLHEAPQDVGSPPLAGPEAPAEHDLAPLATRGMPGHTSGGTPVIVVVGPLSARQSSRVRSSAAHATRQEEREAGRCSGKDDPEYSDGPHSVEGATISPDGQLRL